MLARLEKINRVTDLAVISHFTDRDRFSIAEQAFDTFPDRLRDVRQGCRLFLIDERTLRIEADRTGFCALRDFSFKLAWSLLYHSGLRRFQRF